jgi:hypothetical protein
MVSAMISTVEKRQMLIFLLVLCAGLIATVALSLSGIDPIAILQEGHRDR